MLQSMRDLSQSWVFKGLMMLLALSFGIFAGVGDMFHSNPNQKTVAKVGDVSISVLLLEQHFLAKLADLRHNEGNELSPSQARAQGLLDNSLQAMIEEALFDEEAKRLGLSLSDRDVMERLKALPQFKGIDGKFDVNKWEDAVKRSGLAQRFLVNTEGRQATRRLLLDSIVSGVTPPSLVIDNMYVARGQKRVLDVLVLRNDVMKDLPAADEAALKAYYEANSQAFAAPEYRSITVARLDGAEAAKDLTITDDELKQAYTDRKDEFTHPERRDIVQVVLQDEAKAKDLAGALKGTKDFAKDAKGKGYTAIALTNVDEKAIFSELYAPVFAMEEGEVSQPIHTDMGWHIVQVKKVHAGGITPFEEAKASLLETLKRDRGADAVARTVNQLDDELAANHPLEEVADALRMRITRITDLDAKGLTIEGKPTTDIPAKEAVLKTAFGLSAGEASAVIEDGKGGYVVVRVDDVKPAHIRNFDEVKDRVKVLWIADKRAERAYKEANEMADALRAGKKVVSFATKPGVEIRTSKPIDGLGGADKDLPPVAHMQILSMRVGDVIVVPGGDKQYVLHLADLVPVDPAKPEASRLRLVDALKEIMPYELLEEYATQLRQRFPVKVNETILASMRAKGD